MSNRRLNFGKYQNIREIINSNVLENISITNKNINIKNKIDIDISIFDKYCKNIGLYILSEKDREIIISLFFIKAILISDNKQMCLKNNFSLEGSKFIGFLDSVIMNYDEDSFLLLC